MDFLEGVIDRFRFRRQKTPEAPPPLERKSTPRVWTYDHFKEYMLALGRGRLYLMPLEQYPDIIELGEGWHQSLEDSRRLTEQSSKEHYITIGFNEVNRSLHVPTKPYKGETGSVPGSVVNDSRIKAFVSGTDKILGDVHTHPGRDHLVFSVGDLHRVLTPFSKDYMIGVVGGDETLFAFRTRESIPADLNPNTPDQKSFSKYWYENNGYQYSGIDPHKGEMARPVKKNAPSIWDLNMKIARQHHLILYSGDPHGELVKVFPVRSSA